MQRRFFFVFIGADPEIERQGPMTALSLAASNEQFSIASYLAEGD